MDNKFKKYLITEGSAPVALMNMLSDIKKIDKDFDKNLNSIKAMWRDGVIADDDYESLVDAYKHIVKGLTIFDDILDGTVKTLRGK
jgi:hypothetical protein